MEVLPCSRVAHIARLKKPYVSNIAFHTRRNALRVAEVWMDEFKTNVYQAWNIPMEVGAAPGNAILENTPTSKRYLEIDLLRLIQPLDVASVAIPL
jgi:hypothetical protein